MHIQRGERSGDERKKERVDCEIDMRGRWKKLRYIKIPQGDREQEKREEAAEKIYVFFIPLKLTHIYITFRQKQGQATKTDKGKEENKKIQTKSKISVEG